MTHAKVEVEDLVLKEAVRDLRAAGLKYRVCTDETGTADVAVFAVDECGRKRQIGKAHGDVAMPLGRVMRQAFKTAQKWLDGQRRNAA
jgi:hypothetical protein